MRSPTLFVFAAALARAALALSPDSISSPVTILFQNNVNYTDDVNHQGYLFLQQELSYSAASAACHALGETLVSTASAKTHSDDIVPQLQYLIYRGDLPLLLGGVWLSDGTVYLGIGNLVYTKGTSGIARHPALCTQSSRATLQSASVATTANQISVTTTNQNTYTGFRNLKSFRFLGIQYSNNPARFQYSSISKTAKTALSATSFGPSCWQAGGGSSFSEQCLYLNVYTPFLPTSKASSSSLRPVLVWIHGGAFTSGTGADYTVDGGNMASRGDVVVVTINYRLSTLGFLAIPGTKITGNYGIGDQITALEWIQANIAAFGGDPKRVTIGGQSAGASSVRALLASPKARGLFAAAIPGSNLGGYDYGLTYSTYYTPEQQYSATGGNAVGVLAATGCNSTNLATEVTCITAVSPQTLVTLGVIERYVIVDGSIITSYELNVTSPGQAAHVPVLFGTMADDGAAFIGYPTASSTRTSQVNSVLGQYPSIASAVIADTKNFPLPSTANSTLDLFNVTARLATDVIFRCVDQATVHSAVRNKVFPTAYYYQFDRSYQTPGYDPNAPTCDAPITPGFPYGNPNLPYFKCHSGDLYFTFGTLDQAGLQHRDANDVVFTQLIMDYWTSFIRSHDPNPSPLYLAARGYTKTQELVSQTGHWDPVSPSQDTLRSLAVPPKQKGFLEVPQCAVLGLPLSYYDDQIV